MAYHVEFTRRAVRDLDHLYLSINVAESIPAARWYNRLEKAILSLEHFPYRCPVASESKKTGRQLRHLLYGKRPRVYRVIFEIQEHEIHEHQVLILTIRHWAMDQARPDELD